MRSVLVSVLMMLRGVVASRAALHLEVLALRHQLLVLERSRLRRARLTRADRWLWAWLSRVWGGWGTGLVIGKPGKGVALHRQGFCFFLTGESRRRPWRRTLAADGCALVS